MPKLTHLTRLVSALSTALLLNACSSSNTVSDSPTVSSFYDYQLYSPQQQPLTLEQWAHTAKEADVILVGEWHTHAGIHRFQTEALQQLIKQSKKPVALSMEQFSRDTQAVVDEYLKGEIGEQTLIAQGNAWPNYESDYRPLIELAKTAQIDVIATNAPKPIVRCIAKQGLSYLDKLDSDQRATIAKKIDLEDSPYKAKFMASMHHGQPSQHINMYASQLTWDATMAESIVRYLSQHPGTTVLHTAGKFHTENGLGTAAQIHKLNPNLKVMMVTPVEQVSEQSSDYQLKVLTPPVRYIKEENQQAAFKSMFAQSKPLECN
ncbi:ChaN family lipoprotein [Vibrio gangliei]|uniref:ChaN family lipoprotein n=1 Tax=Vibrio gangliei TaxID=2077090 RepID=UPI000D0129F2|nr:ChaN family lipoprotein [Vibrio gangliei]